LPANRKQDIKIMISNMRISEDLKIGENEYKTNVLNKL
jgi:hypothetical protein